MSGPTFTGKRFRVNGIDMNVVIAGDGPPVLLVHGYPDDHTVWRHQLPALINAGYRVIAPDMRGCGETEISPNVADYRIPNLVADLLGLLDALGIDKVRLVAHDWGAVISWHFAIAHPERVDRYVALSVGHPATYGRGGSLRGSITTAPISARSWRAIIPRPKCRCSASGAPETGFSPNARCSIRNVMSKHRGAMPGSRAPTTGYR